MTPEEWGSRALAALCNGTYQGLFLGAVIWAALRFRRGLNAASRYAIAFTGLLVVAALPVAHFIAGLEPGVRAFPAAGAEREGASSVPSAVEAPRVEAAEGIAIAISSFPPREEPSAASIEVESGQAAGGFAWKEPGEKAPTSVRAEPARSPVGVLGGKVEARLPGWVVAGLLAGWALMAATRLLCLARQVGLLMRLKGEASPIGRVREIFEQVRAQLGVKRNVELRVARGVRSPLVVGYFSPAVVMPPELIEGDDRMVEVVFRHELAHVARRDDWTNLVQQVIAAVMFFQPAVWWLSRRMTVEREVACDDHVLARGGERREYALFLTDLAGRMQGRDWAAAPGAGSNRSQLKERIVMILNSRRNGSPRLSAGSVGGTGALALLVAAAGLVLGPRVALAQDDEERSPDRRSVEGGGASVESDHGRIRISNGEAEIEARVNVDGESNVFRWVAPPDPAAPPAPPAPEARANDSQSLERRLERLERMMESLLNRSEDGVRKRDGKSEVPGGPAGDRVTARVDGKSGVHPGLEPGPRVDGKPAADPAAGGLEHVMDTVRREVEHAVRQAQSAARVAAETARRHAQEASRQAAELVREQAREMRRGAARAKPDAGPAPGSGKVETLEEPRKRLRNVESLMEELTSHLSRLSEQLERSAEDMEREIEARMEEVERRIERQAEELERRLEAGAESLERRLEGAEENREGKPDAKRGRTREGEGPTKSLGPGAGKGNEAGGSPRAAQTLY